MVFCLAQHADYLCRNSGACCTSNWPIHIESQQADTIRTAIADRVLAVDDPSEDPFDAAVDLPPGAEAVIRTTPRGACVFHDAGGRRCRIHRALGHGALPSACQHFPRRCLIERDAVYVSLSHYCPTVAAMAIAGNETRGIVAAPTSLVGHVRLEGLDAREVLPPLLRPGMLTDLEGYHAWERAVVGFLESGEAADEALWRVGEMTRRLEEWKPGAQPLSESVMQAASERARTRPLTREVAGEANLCNAFETVRHAIPESVRPAPSVLPLGATDRRWVAGRWDDFAPALGRYLAAHALGNWSAYFGGGLRTVVRHLELALALARMESGRLCEERERPLDAPLLSEAFRAADLLLVHLADPRALARCIDNAATRG